MPFHNPDNIESGSTPYGLEDPKPSMAETFGAAFRRENLIGSLMKVPRGDDLQEIDPDYNPFDGLEDRFIPHAHRFENVFNERAGNARKTQIDMEEKDRQTLAASGWTGFGATIAATLTDPTILIPGGTIYRGVKTGQVVAKTAASASAMAGVATAAQEVGLQATQETRTLEESAMNIGGSMILGGFIGGGIGALSVRRARRASQPYSSEEWQRAGSRFDESMRPDFDAANDELHREMKAIAAGAAARKTDTLDDLSIEGKAASAVARSTAKLNPLLRTLTSPSVAVRSVASRMMDTPVYLKKNVAGEGDIAAETAMNEFTRGAVMQAIEAQDSAYKAARHGGVAISRKEFREAVGMAMRRNDESDIPGVSEAAKAWRRFVIEPLKDRAIKAGMLPDDVAVTTAPSYFSRVYNRPYIEANEGEFRAVVREWVSGELDRELARKGDPLGQFVSDADKQEYIAQIVDDVYDKVTGRMHDGALPLDIKITERGPLKERTLLIPDEKIEKFLESDAEFIGRRYARIMAADIELTNRFGSADMTDALIEVREDYKRLRKGVTNEKELAKLAAREKADIRDLTGVRDILRGHYRPEIQHTTWARILRAANVFNYMRALGGVTISSMSDTVRPAMVHGLKAYTKDAIVPLIRNTRAIKMAKQEAKLAGAVAEKVLASRLATLAEIADPYSMRSPFERFLDNSAAGFSRMTGILHWNDFQKTVAAVLTQNRILENADKAARSGFDSLPKKEQAYMGFLGLGRDRAEQIGKLFATHGEIADGVRVANTDAWGNDADALRSAYRAAINKDVDSIIVTKGAGDVPLAANTPIGRALLQFRSFALASNQRVLIRGLQEDKTRFIGGMLGMSTIGMFIYYLKQIESGREVSDNPGTWVAEGLDRSGIFSVAFEVNNALEKVGAPGAYTLAASAFPDKSQRQPASRYAIRSKVGSFLGPSFGLATDTTGLLSMGFDNMRKAAAGEDLNVTPSDVSSVRRLTPWASLPYWRWFIDGMLVKEAKEAVE